MILTKYEDRRSGSLCCINLFPFLNTTFPNRIIFVLFVYSGATFRYSQDLIEKNRAPIINQAIAFSHSDTASSSIFLSTVIGRAFCFNLVPSWLRYPLNCSWRIKHVLPSASNLGSGLLFYLNDCDIYDKMALTVSSTSSSLFLLVKVASRIAWEKADMRIFFWNLENSSM